VFAADVSDITINGHSLVSNIADEDRTAQIPALTMVAGENRVTFNSALRIGDPQARPFAWIRGRFRLRGATSPVAGPNGTVRIEGPFVLEAAAAKIDRDLTEARYPFVRAAVRATAVVDLPAGSSLLSFDGIAADAARVEIDGGDCGYIWGSTWNCVFPKALVGGQHKIALTLYPSAFNTFGPHHHLDGDMHIVSPVQFEGRKNFADRPDAPAQTNVSGWHVKPLRFPASLRITTA
jgi:hypothetical protein